ncbi:MAG: helix-turn-helix domain-containing protein [candidate division NC10 bacterium]|nr:helix-turn-helix domain-containing protein [candidate division NC10 bacterium]
MRDAAPHILIVDDDPAIREALAAALQGTYVVHSAATGKEACALLRRHPVAAIVLDAVLGDEHGLDLIARFRKLSPAPILVLTGYGSEELAVRAVRTQVDDYLKKPVKLPELQATLSRLVHQGEPPLDPVAHACRLLDEHPEQQHTTAPLAEEVGLSERHLRRRFQEAYGKTPRRYLTEVRMQRARKLLRTTRLGIEQIAQAVGYARLTTFCRIFKTSCGVTPSEFRSHQGSLGDRKVRPRRRRRVDGRK